jgi:LacI family transcriptional regulator
MVTLQDISERVNLSKATVSLVLNGRQYHRVSEETRLMIEKVADELGYRPNRTAQYLTRGRTMNVMLLLNDLRNPFYATLASHVAQRLQPHGYYVLPLETLGSAKREKELLELATGNVCDGVLCLEMLPDQKVNIYDDVAKRIPLVIRHPVLGPARRRLPRGISRVTVDYGKGMETLWEHFRMQGAKRLGLLLHSQHDPNLSVPDASIMGRHLADSFEKNASWLERISIALVDDEYPLRAWYKAARKLLLENTDLDSLYVHHFRAMPPVLTAIEECGLVVGKDIRVASTDENESTQWMRPALTVVGESLDVTADHLVKQLLDQLQNKAKPVSCVIDTRLIVRKSTANL